MIRCQAGSISTVVARGTGPRGRRVIEVDRRPVGGDVAVLADIVRRDVIDRRFVTGQVRAKKSHIAPPSVETANISSMGCDATRRVVARCTASDPGPFVAGVENPTLEIAGKLPPKLIDSVI